MPWWGWLIIACVVIVVGGWITVVVIVSRAGNRAMERADEAFDRRAERMRGPRRPW